MLKTTRKDIILGIVICLVLGLGSGYAVKTGDPSWYLSLKKPALNPPSWVFGPVWTVLYIMIGAAAAYIFNSKDSVIKILFVLQFACNLLWSPLFFYMQRVDLALFDILLLIALLISLMFKLWTNQERAAFTLLLPYLIWVSFATFLNYKIYITNF